MRRSAVASAVWRWQGLALMTVSIVVSIWLAATGQLILYIHPRYVLFTVIMAVIGLAFVVASFLPRATHDHEERPSGAGAVFSGIATAATLTLAATLMVLPPATLSSATADQRGINTTGVRTDGASVDDVASATDAAVASFTVLDWASLLRQTSDVGFYDGKPASVVGFITRHPDDPENMFYLSRFVITCCAVDAQPIGLPVYLENWEGAFAVDEWVAVDGGFRANPSRQGTQPIVLVPADIQVIEQPTEPYLY